MILIKKFQFNFIIYICSISYQLWRTIWYFQVYILNFKSNITCIDILCFLFPSCLKSLAACLVFRSVWETPRAWVIKLHYVPGHNFCVNRKAKENLRLHNFQSSTYILYFLALFKYLIYQRFILISEWLICVISVIIT